MAKVRLFRGKIAAKHEVPQNTGELCGSSIKLYIWLIFVAYLQEVYNNGMYLDNRYLTATPSIHTKILFTPEINIGPENGSTDRIVSMRADIGRLTDALARLSPEERNPSDTAFRLEEILVAKRGLRAIRFLH